jgi:hypothetical protein
MTHILITHLGKPRLPPGVKDGHEQVRIIVNWRSRVKLTDSNKPVSGITGAVHCLLI